MRLTNRKFAAWLMVAGLAVTTSTGSQVFSGPPVAYASATGTGIESVPGTGVVAADSTAYVRVVSHPTGNKDQDAYCSQAADLINQAFQGEANAELYGDEEGAQEWHDLAIEMLVRARDAGCNFSTATTTGPPLTGPNSGATTPATQVADPSTHAPGPGTGADSGTKQAPH